MSSDIKGKVGWLKDENGEIFIPKTLTNAIQNAEGTNLDNLLKNLSPSPDGEGGNSQNGGVNAIISTLYTNESGTIEDTINLTDDISNYDLLLLEGFHKNPYNDGRNYHNSSIYNANELCVSPSAIAICNDGNYIWYQLSDNRTLSLKNKSGDYYMLSNIYGIKFSSSGSGSGSSFTSEILYTATGTGRSEIELSKPYTDFDYLDITILKFDDNNYYDFMHTFIDCAQQADIMNNNLFTGRTNSNIIDVWATANSFMRYKFTDTTHITYPMASGSNTIFQVKGIKFATNSSSGGASETGILVLTPTEFENLSPLPESGIIGITSSDSSPLIKNFYDMSKYIDVKYNENVWNEVLVASSVNTATANELTYEDTVNECNVFCVLAENVLNSSYQKYDTLTIDSVEQSPIKSVTNNVLESNVYFSNASGAYKATSYSEGNNWNNQAIIFAKVPWSNCEFVQDFVQTTNKIGYIEYVADRSGYYLLPITTGGQNEHSITIDTNGIKKELKTTHSYGRYADLYGIFLKIGQTLRITCGVANTNTSYVYCGIYYMK